MTQLIINIEKPSIVPAIKKMLSLIDGVSIAKQVKVKKEEATMSKKAFYEQIETAIDDAKAGRAYPMHANESLEDYLARMEAAGNV